MNLIGSKILRTARLTLRPFRASDAEDMFYGWANDSEVTKYLTWSPHQSVEETRVLLKEWEKNAEKKDVFQWAITLNENGKVIGSIGAVEFDCENERAQTGDCLSRAFWGQGIMTEALGEVIRFFFEEVGVQRVYAEHVEENVGSGKVMEKCGMKYEGKFIRHHRLRSSGEWVNIVRRAILADEYAKIKQNDLQFATNQV